VTIFNICVEGESDVGAVASAIQYAGGSVGGIFGRGGKSKVLARLEAYNQAAERMPWAVVVDLDHDFDDAGKASDAWLGSSGAAPLMAFGIAVREVESWLIADREALSDYLGVSIDRITEQPDSLDDPKQYLVNLARHSRLRTIRESLVPRKGSGASVGPLYASEIRRFGEGRLDVARACQRSASLREFVASVEAVVLRGA